MVNKIRRNHEALLRLPRTICPEGYVPDFVMTITNLREKTIRGENVNSSDTTLRQKMPVAS
jgi:hypothetical protein